MPMPPPGTIVRIARRVGIWVVKEPDIFAIPPESAVRCISNALIGHRMHRTSFQAGLGDLEVVHPAPTFAPGQELKHDGETVTVIEDQGAVVRCAMPRERRQIAKTIGTRRPVYLNLGAGEADLEKAPLVLQNLQAVLP